MPLENTYFPLVPWLIAVLHGIIGVDFVQGYHYLLCLCYVIAPCALFALAMRLYKSTVGAGVAVAMFSFISLSAILFPEIHRDLGSFYHSRRFHTLVFYGEGPHNFALAFVPLAILFMIRFVEMRSRRDGVLWLMSSLVTILSNPFGAVALSMATGAVIFASPQVFVRLWRPIALLGLAIPAFLVTLFVPPEALQTIYQKSKTVGGDFKFGGSTLLKVLLGLALLIPLHFALLRAAFASRFVTAFASATLVVPAAWYWFESAILPQPKRYHLEVEMAVALALGLVVTHLVALRPRVSAVVASLMTVVCLALFPGCYSFSMGLVHPVDFTSTDNYAVIEWIRTHTSPNSRLMASGELGFALNLFVNNSQINSGHEPSSPNSVQPIGVYTIYSGENAGQNDTAISILWLKALGASRIVIPRHAPCDHCVQPFRNPDKFEGGLVKEYESPTWRVYNTGLVADSEFRVVDGVSVLRRRPVHGLDTEALRQHVESFESQSQNLVIQRLSPGHILVSGSFLESDLVKFATTYSRYWTATVVSSGNKLGIQRDGLDFMYFKPPTGSPSTIELVYEGGSVGMRFLSRILQVIGWRSANRAIPPGI